MQDEKQGINHNGNKRMQDKRQKSAVKQLKGSFSFTHFVKSTPGFKGKLSDVIVVV